VLADEPVRHRFTIEKWFDPTDGSQFASIVRPLKPSLLVTSKPF
jgi:hypothetical protein